MYLCIFRQIACIFHLLHHTSLNVWYNFYVQKYTLIEHFIVYYIIYNCKSTNVHTLENTHCGAKSIESAVR